MKFLSKVKPIYLLIGIQTLLIIILIAFVIFRKPLPVLKTQDNEKSVRDSIKLLMKRYYVLEQDKIRLNYENDSLIKIKTPITKNYEKKIKHVQNAPIDSVASFIHDALKGSD